jgi:glycosyltransferase involved in cell wall biosynthesis
MTRKEILLTIAIPTFNRCNYLRELLPAFIQQVEKENIGNEIEILINDNASEDDTRTYVEGFVSFPWLKYSRNSVNVGGDQNFIECVKKAKGKYVWLFGDDDILHNSALEKLLRIIREYDPALIIVRDGEYGNLKESGLFDNYGRFVKYICRIQPNYIIAHTLITSNVFQRNIFDLQVAQKFIMTNYGHMYAIAGNLKKSGKVFVSVDKVFKVREQRAKFAQAPKNLRLKLIRYLVYLGETHRSPELKVFAYRFFLIEDIFINIPKRYIKKILIFLGIKINRAKNR